MLNMLQSQTQNRTADSKAEIFFDASPKEY